MGFDCWMSKILCRLLACADWRVGFRTGAVLIVCFCFALVVLGCYVWVLCSVVLRLCFGCVWLSVLWGCRLLVLWVVDVIKFDLC